MFRSICLSVVSALIAACATPPASTIVLPSSFWQEKAGKIGVVMVELPKGAVHMVGPQDALDRAIANAADAPLRSYLERVRPGEFQQITEAFSARLRAQGYTVSVVAEPMELGQYDRLRAKDAAKLADRDVTQILGKYGVDRLLLLSVDRFGAFRDYFVFVPTAAPLAMFQVRGELIDLTNNQILWRASTAQKQNLVAIEGNWDQPPDYPNLTQAIRRAEHDAVVYLQNAFFSGAH
jgi:hypothetical protein